MNDPGGPLGVLVAQLGTPDAPTPGALRRYLREFLGDPRILDMPRLARALLLYTAILPFRPRRSAALYRNIWTSRGSPLLLHARAQERGLAERLGEGFAVGLGMRYGNPGIRSALLRLLERGVRRLVVLSMFPQYSSSTTASLLDAICGVLLDRRDVPAFRVVREYPSEPGYIDAVARLARDAAGADGFSGAPFVFSFHGVPARFVDDGDPYREQCWTTAGALAESLSLPEDRWTLAYQSRFGREEWLGPATDDVLADLARRGHRRVVVLTPGFTADCLETIDEIGRESAFRFRDAGGEELLRVPCVNDDPGWLDTMATLVRREAAGWV